MRDALFIIAAFVLGALTHRFFPRKREAPPPPPEPIDLAPSGDALNQAVQGVRDALKGGRTILWRLSPDGAQAYAWVVNGGSFPIPVLVGGDVLGWALRQKVAVRAETAPMWAAKGTTCCAVGPVLGKNSVAVFSTEYEDVRALPEIGDLDRASAYLAEFLDLEHEREKTEAHRLRLDALMAALKRLPSEIDPESVAHELADSALRLTGTVGACVVEWRNDVGTVVALAGAAGGPAHDTTIQMQESETAIAARSGVAIVRDAQRPGIPVIANKERFLIPPRAFAAVPLIITEGEVIATVTVWSGAATIEPAGLESLETLAPYSALQLRHARSFGILRAQADRDPLTGLFNRQAFDHQIRAETARFERYGGPFALVLIDIDHFKSVNDRFGHPAGDAVLVNIAKIVTRSLRRVDTAARYGGEEFAIILPVTDLELAMEIAERLRISIAESTVVAGGVTLNVTASLGVSACPETAVTPESLIAAADIALYKSKQEGRNRVTPAEPFTSKLGG